jgi:hypothetical protein
MGQTGLFRGRRYNRRFGELRCGRLECLDRLGSGSADGTGFQRSPLIPGLADLLLALNDLLFLFLGHCPPSAKVGHG